MSHKITDAEEEKIESLEKLVQSKLLNVYRIRCFLPEYQHNYFGLHIIKPDNSIYDVKFTPKQFTKLNIQDASQKIVSAIKHNYIKDEKSGPGKLIVTF